MEGPRPPVAVVVPRPLEVLFLAATAVLVVDKAWLRPWARATEWAEPLLPVVGSLPNASEAVMGTLILGGLAAVLRSRPGGPAARSRRGPRRWRPSTC